MSYSTILEDIKLLPVAERLELLEAVSRMIREDLTIPVGSILNLSASQIRRLPLAEQQRILSQSARLALADYQPGSELVEFSEDLADDELYEYEAI